MPVDHEDAAANAAKAVGARIGEAQPLDPNLAEDRFAAEIEAELSEAVTEVRGARAFTHYYGKDWRYVAVWGKWLFWNGKHWQFGDQLLLQNFIMRIVRKLRLFAKTEKQLATVESLRMIRSIEGILKADRMHAASVDRWD